MMHTPNIATTSLGGTTQYATYDYLGAGTPVYLKYPVPDYQFDLTPNDYERLDRFGRVVTINWYDNDEDVTRDEYHYAYDRAGNRTYRENVLAAAKDQLYGHDNLNRLNAIQRGTLNGGKDAITTLAFAQDWSLDTLNNWAIFKQDDDGNSTWDLEQTRDHNEANEVTDITGSWPDPVHDKAGNMIEMPSALAPGKKRCQDDYIASLGGRPRGRSVL